MPQFLPKISLIELLAIFRQEDKTQVGEAHDMAQSLDDDISWDEAAIGGYGYADE